MSNNQVVYLIATYLLFPGMLLLGLTLMSDPQFDHNFAGAVLMSGSCGAIFYLVGRDNSEQAPKFLEQSGEKPWKE